ncbi:MAG: hypothetical protein IAE93_09995 [Ignavibacteria bacterium]|nr:hypothetical protein [Ignavibacteria bacterium]
MKLINFTFILLTVWLCFFGCDKEGETPQSSGQNGSGSSGRRIEIIDILPNTGLSSVTRDSFDVTVKGHNIYMGVYVHVEIKSISGTNCIGFSDSAFITSGQPSTTIKVRTDSIANTCITQNSVFQVLAWFNDTLNIPRKDSVYYQWGNPTAGNTITANIEPWRMQYVSDILADTLNKCIRRSLNPSDSNIIKCDVIFDNIQTASDTNFMVGAGNEDLLILMCNWWSQNHYINQSRNKVIYAKLTDVNPNLVGWSRTGEYPPASTNNYSFIFYNNIYLLCPDNGTRNDTTVGNLTAVHEIMHQLANSHDDKGHKYHYGYFEDKCALLDEEAPFQLSTPRRRYINRFRICMNHTIHFRKFRGATLLDNTLGNIIYTQFVATDPFKKAASEKDENKYSVSISLPKQEYKKYEPVIARVSLVNHDTKPLDIYNIYDRMSSEPKFTIKNQLGNIYDNRSMVGFYLSTYTTELAAGDSLVFSLVMNHWGEPTLYNSTKSLDEVYFSQFGYFPVGEYKAVFHCSPLRNDEEIFSNEVVFKVVELTVEDKEVLNLYKENKYDKNKYDEIVAKYPNNVFAEHILKRKMSLHYSSDITDNTENDYKDFLEKYPNSMYFYSPDFIFPYVNAAEQKHNSFQGGIDYLLSLHGENETISKSLSNMSFTTIIKKYIEFYFRIK